MAASRVQPVAAAMAWPAVIVSQETRLSLPSRCSTTTKMVSGIKAASSSWLLAKEKAGETPALQHAQFVTQFVHQLFRDLGWRAFYVFGLLRFLRYVQAFDFLQVLADCRLHLRQRHLADGFVLRLLDADQRGIAQLVNAGLNCEHGRQRHVDELKESRLEFALHADAGLIFFNLHDDGGVRPAQQFRQYNPC